MPVNELREGHYVKLVGSSAPEELKPKFWKIGAVEALDFTTGDQTATLFSAVATGASSGFINIDTLDPARDPRHLFYVVAGFKDGCRYQIKIPNGSDRMGVDDTRDIARLDNVKSPYNDPNTHYAFYLIKDMYPAIQAINATGVSLTPQVFFTGEKYDLDEISNPDLINKLKNFELGITPYVPFKAITLGGVKQ